MNAYPRRIHFDANGILWVCEYRAGKLASFDPKTEAIKEYALPGLDATPYAMNIDKRGHVWYSSMETDIVGELDPSTGHVTKYPFVYPENGMRDFFMDANGNMWWGSQPNNHIGYFYLAGPEIRSCGCQRALQRQEAGAGAVGVGSGVGESDAEDASYRGALEEDLLARVTFHRVAAHLNPFGFRRSVIVIVAFPIPSKSIL